MISPSPKPTYVLVFLFAIFLQFSCSKDSDLLADYVIQDSQSVLIDIKVFANTNKPVVIDPINDVTNAIITEVSEPSEGTAEVNPDNTITYTPDSNITGTDEFSITTDVTNTNNTVTTNTTEVTVTVVDAKLPLSGSNVYYVTTNGKSTNNGKTESTAWGISDAFKAAKAGDIIHIKAGNYGNKNLVVGNSGTLASPIRFIGYTSIPSDLVSDKGSTFTYGDALDASKMPLIKSNSGGSSGIGIYAHENYIEIENFQVQLYDRGIDAKGNRQVFRNIITYQTGVQNSNSTQKGQGVVLRGNNSTLENCFDYNSNAQGLTLNGATNSLISYSQVYNDNEINPGGYYILLSGGTTNSVVENCLAYKKPGLFHGGHGYGMKDVATNNIIRKSVAYNTGIEANFRDVHDNLWEDIEIHGIWPNSDRSDNSASIKLSNGSHHNTFNNILFKNVKRVFTFMDWDDGLVGNGGDLQEGSHDNVFNNIAVDNAASIVVLLPGESPNTSSYNNTWNNCSFKNVDLGFALLTKNSNNKMVNCSFDKINRWEANEFDFNFSFQNCTFTNCGFSTEGISD